MKVKLEISARTSSHLDWVKKSTQSGEHPPMSSSLHSSLHQSEKHLMHNFITSFWVGFMKMHVSSRAIHMLLGSAPSATSEAEWFSMKKIHLLEDRREKEGIVGRKNKLHLKKAAWVTVGNPAISLFTRNETAIIHFCQVDSGYLAACCFSTVLIFKMFPKKFLMDSACSGTFTGY